MALAWMAFAWPRLAFPADAPAPATGTQAGLDTGADDQPVDSVVFLGGQAATPGADAPADQPAPSLRLAPIAIGYGGSLGYDIEQRSSRGSDARLLQKLILDMKGMASTYIWQPWIAQVNGNLGFTATKSVSNDIGMSNNRISGGAALGLVPYSRYPFKMDISRTQSYMGPGLGTPTSQTTRFGMNQRYTPVHRMESYQVAYTRSQSDSGDIESARQTGLSFSAGTGRFKQQSLEAEGTLERDQRLGASASKNTLSNQIAVKHRYRPIGGLSIENNASLFSTSDQELLTTADSRIRELNTTMSLQPTLAPYSVIGSARVYVADLSSPGASSQTRIANANLGARYRPTQYITLSASGNVNVTNSKRTHSLSATQSATLTYPMDSLDLDGWRYTPALSASLSNSSVNSTGQAGSVQSASISPSHSLSRSTKLNGGNLNLRLNQALSVSESTRSQATSRLTHSAAVNWHRMLGKSNTSLRLSGRDSRSLTRTQDVFQDVELSATISEEFSRDSNLIGTLSAQAARQVNPVTESSNVSTGSIALLRYSHQRAFDIPRLIFNSEVRTNSRAIIPVLAATPDDQGPVTWENSLQYQVGRLITSFRANLSKSGDGSTQSLIAFSLKRFF